MVNLIKTALLSLTLTSCTDYVMHPVSKPAIKPRQEDQPYFNESIITKTKTPEISQNKEDIYENLDQFYDPSVPLDEIIKQCEGKQRRIVVTKSARRLSLYCDDLPLKQYKISLGFQAVGDKLNEGDGRTPEGKYFIRSKFPGKFHKSLLLSYPNEKDAERGLQSGLINLTQYSSIVNADKQCLSPPQNTKLGGLLEIHGGGGYEDYDWTFGCIALNDEAVDEVYGHFVQLGCVRKKENDSVSLVPKVIVEIKP
ncbi:MAG: L,D-transpeptidase family protein [Nanoarchaeota archaeon]|nr:L,D-transpeptidase family protein [Nanoarchaeota archaeon]MBU1643776.1 L,D-transpeptidase family protein [Nanoarchaeota archaeon]MBU1976385.1 L,D-transpeptidase family protein [Nanoarchaeota archaeon]